jgi:tetratricopeptide (TPR) repeat protein
MAALALLALAAGALAGPAAASTPSCSAAKGQALIDQGRYEHATHEFTCVIDAQPTEVEGYRGRIEAEVLLGRYSDAVRDYQRVTAFVLPVHPDAAQTIHDGYAARLTSDPNSIPALTGESFARWWFFDYASAIHMLNRLVDMRPNDVYPNLFRGSSRLLLGATKARGVADLERAIQLAPESPDVRFIVADAYTYGLHDPDRAFAEATRALDWGLDTPRIHAILATSYNAFGDLEAAATHIQRSIELVTTELVPTAALVAGDSLSLDLAPGRTYAIPIAATAGETISIATKSGDFWDSIAVLLAPDGSPVVGSDDDNAYFAAFDWVAEQTGTYMLQVTSFEAVSTGELVVTRA